MSQRKFPRISVVTPSYNQGPFIEETIKSILDQDYPDIELIVMDAASTDETVSILKKYSDRIAYWESQKDEGQADALNKGFARATGEICCYLNSDDTFYPGAFQHIAKMFEDENVKWVATSTSRSTKSEPRRDIWNPDPSTLGMFVNKQTIPQQGVFWRAQPNMLPYFNKHMFYAMDHDFFIRYYIKFGAPKCDNFLTSFFRQHENSKTTLYEDRLKKDLDHLRELYSKQVDEVTRKQINKEYERLEVVRRLQKAIATGEKIGVGGAVRILLSTPYAFRNRQIMALIKRAI